jgi:hypothetical protein
MIARRIVVLALVLMLAACSQGKANPAAPALTPTSSSAPVPSPQLVAFTSGMCTSIAELATAKAALGKLREDLKNPSLATVRLVEYLALRTVSIQELSYDFARLRASGVPAADRLAAHYKVMVARVAPKIAALSGQPGEFGPAETLRRARQVDALLASVTPTGPDLRTIADTDPLLAAAHRQTLSCNPTSSKAPATPLPAAADGGNYQACVDGTCEVLVNKSATITVRGVRFGVEVNNGYVAFSRDSGDYFYITLSEVGPVRWGPENSWVQAQLTGVNGTSAVMRFTAK